MEITGGMIVFLIVLAAFIVAGVGIGVQTLLIKRQLKHIEKHGLREPLKSLYDYMLELEKSDGDYARLIDSVSGTAYGVGMVLGDCHENTHEIREGLGSIEKDATIYLFNGDAVTELTEAEENFFNKKINFLLSVKRSKKQRDGELKRHANHMAAERSLKDCLNNERSE